MNDPIKVIDAPKVYLVGRQSIDEGELSRFLADEGVESWTTDTDVAGQRLVEVAGRLCYKSYAKPRPGGNKGYIDHILEVGHGSVLEHAVFNFIITGVSRSFTHELIRHRAGFGYSQLSQRFVDESSASFVVPSELRDEVAGARAFLAGISWTAGAANFLADRLDVIHDPGPAVTAGLRWLAILERAQDAYAELSDYLFLKVLNRHYPQDGVSSAEGAHQWAKRACRQGSGEIVTGFRKKAREAARSVLPNAIETQIFVTGNARALRHLVEMRGDIHADAEIRRVALAMLEILRVESPNLFGDYILNQSNGEPYADTPFRKV